MRSLLEIDFVIKISGKKSRVFYISEFIFKCGYLNFRQTVRFNSIISLYLPFFFFIVSLWYVSLLSSLIFLNYLHILSHFSVRDILTDLNFLIVLIIFMQILSFL